VRRTSLSLSSFGIPLPDAPSRAGPPARGGTWDPSGRAGSPGREAPCRSFLLRLRFTGGGGGAQHSNPSFGRETWCVQARIGLMWLMWRRDRSTARLSQKCRVCLVANVDSASESDEEGATPASGERLTATSGRRPCFFIAPCSQGQPPPNPRSHSHTPLTTRALSPSPSHWVLLFTCLLRASRPLAPPDPHKSS
jgi:hypothetical protein